jgi:hypothetical protein
MLLLRQILTYLWLVAGGLGPWAVVLGSSSSSSNTFDPTTGVSRWAQLVSLQSTRHRVLESESLQSWGHLPPPEERILARPLSALKEKQSQWHHRREQTDNFRVSYVGEFRILSTDATACTNPSPVLHAYCSGGTLTVDDDAGGNTNNPNVVCTSYTSVEFGLVGVECVVDCTTASSTTTADCNDFYVSSSDYGQVYFSCTGATASDVLGFWEWSDTGDGTCIATTSTATTSTNLRFHAKFARLGLVCASGDGGTVTLIDDYLAECTVALPLDDGDDYACTSGAPCDTSSTTCTIDYDDIRILAQLENAPSNCITSLTGLPFDGRVDPEPIGGGGLATARFQVSLGVMANVQSSNDIYDEPTTDCTTPGDRTILISCTNGGTIAWNQANSSTTVDCIATSTGTALECTDSTGSINSLTLQVNYVRWEYGLVDFVICKIV